MKTHDFCCLGLACLSIAFIMSGCDTTGGDIGNGNVKSQGVYTTLDLPRQGLEMPGSGFLQKTSFGPGETPDAVVVGYGNYNQQQLISLQLLESATGRSLVSGDYYASYGKAVVVPLAIRLNGDYELKLTSKGTQLDDWRFTVTRPGQSPVSPSPNTAPAAKYAEGVFSVRFNEDSSDVFNGYDSFLGHALVNAVTKEADSANRDIFAQRFPGSTVIQCHLDFQGRLTDPKILENNLDDACGQVFLKALLDHSPYPVWPADVRQRFGSDDRPLKLTVKFE